MATTMTPDQRILSTLATRAGNASTIAALETAFGNAYTDFSIRETCSQLASNGTVTFVGSTVTLV